MKSERLDPASPVRTGTRDPLHVGGAQSYALAVVAVAIATAVRWPLHAQLQSTAFFPLFLVAIVVAARYGGLGPGLLATALSGALGTFYLLQYGPPGIDGTESLSLGLSMSLALIFTGFMESLHRSRRRTSEVEEENARLGRTVESFLASVPAVVWEAGGEPTSARQAMNFVSNHVESMLGYTVEEWQRTPNFWLSIVHPEDRAAAASRAVETYAGVGEGSNRFRWVAKDGHIVWTETRSSALRNAEGRTVGMRGVTIDISARRRAEMLAAESEARFQFVADNAPVLIWMADQELLCDWFNRPWLEFTGRTLEDERGNGWEAGVHGLDLERCRAERRAARDARRSFRLEYRLRRADGAYRWILDHGAPRLSSVGELLGYVGTAMDIHDRKVAEEDREHLLAVAEAATAAAELANRAKDEFLSTLSHELRTPLNSISGWTQVISKDPSPAILARGLEVISRSVRAQDRLIQDLLDVSRIVSGNMRLDVQEVRVASTIEAALDNVKPAIDAKNIRLETVLDSAILVGGDPVRLQQIVWNLVSNAVKFSRAGGRVSVGLAHAGSELELRVADDGAGIAADFLPHVFDRFSQENSTSQRNYGGLGLGLAIARHLTELHGGTIRAESPGTGLGAAFIVRLPLLASNPTSLAAAAPG